MAKEGIPGWKMVVYATGTTSERDTQSAGLGQGDAGGFVWYNKSVGRLQIWDGANWENMSGFGE